MRDLTKKDIIIKTPQIYNRYAEIVSGVWKELQAPDPDFTQDGVGYTKINKNFGILRQSDNQIFKPPIKGRPGDYLVTQKNSSYLIIPKQEFNILFPKKRNPKPKFKPLNSRSI